MARWASLFGRRMPPRIITDMAFRSYERRWYDFVLQRKHRQGRAPLAKFVTLVVKNGMRASPRNETDPLSGPLALNLSTPSNPNDSPIAKTPISPSIA